MYIFNNFYIDKHIISSLSKICAIATQRLNKKDLIEYRSRSEKIYLHLPRYRSPHSSVGSPYNYRGIRKRIKMILIIFFIFSSAAGLFSKMVNNLPEVSPTIYEQVVQAFSMHFNNPEASLIDDNFSSLVAILGIFLGYYFILVLSIKRPAFRELILMTVDRIAIPAFIPYIIMILYSFSQNAKKYILDVFVKIIKK